MMKMKKAMAVIALMIMMAVTISGCGNLTADIKLNADNSATADLTIMSVDLPYTRVYLEDAKDYLKTNGYDIQNENTTNQNNVPLTTFSAKKSFSDLNAFLADMKYLYSMLPLDNKGDMIAEFKNNIGPFINSKEIKVKVPLASASVVSVLKSVQPEEKETINNILRTIAPGEQAEAMIAMDQDSWATAIGELVKKNFGVATRLTATDENFSTNTAYFNQDPKAAIWMFSPGNDESTVLPITAVHTSDSKVEPVMNNSLLWVSETPNIIGIVLCSVILLGLIVFLIIKFGRKPKKKEEEAAVGVYSDALPGSDEFEDFSDASEVKEEQESDENVPIEEDSKEDEKAEDKVEENIEAVAEVAEPTAKGEDATPIIDETIAKMMDNTANADELLAKLAPGELWIKVVEDPFSATMAVLNYAMSHAEASGLVLSVVSTLSPRTGETAIIAEGSDHKQYEIEEITERALLFVHEPAMEHLKQNQAIWGRVKGVL